MRPVWLALVCLTGLVMLVAIRFGATPLASADAARVETPTTVADPQQTTSTKADKLQVSYSEPAMGRTTVTPVAIVPPISAPKSKEETTKIVSRHWHDPLAPKASSNADPSKNKLSKASTR
jgi:hypothetical protein